MGMRSAAIEIVKEDGPNALLGGLGPTVIGYGVEGAMKFGVYEIMKPVFASLLSGGDGDGKNAPAAFLMASIVAGAVASMLLCPMESTRIKIVTDRAYAGKGFVAALSKLMADEGFFSTFAGIWAMLAKQVPYTFGKQVSFDVFAGLLYAFFHHVQESMSIMTDRQIKWAVSVTAAFLASIIACIFSQPGDMILTETYRKPGSSEIELPAGAVVTGVPPPKGQVPPILQPKKAHKTFPEVVQSIYDAGGLAKFFTGTRARIVHVGLIITTQLVIYDIVKQLLGLPATGSH